MSSIQRIPFEKRIVGHETIETVNGRDLHAGLEIAKHYSDWMKAQIKRAQLDENKDFVLFHQKGEYGNKPTVEYFLTFDASKHVAMMSGSKKGKEVREYFIACEKALRGDSALDHYPELKAANQALIASAEAKFAAEEAQKAANAAHEAAVQAHETALTALRGQQWVTIRQFVHIHGLQHQLSTADQKQYARHLGQYCQEKGIPMYKAATADEQWPEERTYHAQAIADTLGQWLARREAPSFFVQHTNDVQ